MPGKLYVHEDIMGSARRFTDGKGVTFGEIEYDIWGLPCVKAGAGNAGEGYEDILNPRYTNHTYDDVLGMYHAQFRFFDAGSRGFVQEDPIKDDLNWYGYCGGNPISNIDPIGCAAITVPPEISNYLNAISVDPITFGLGIAFGVVAFPFYYAYVNDINVAPPLAD